MRKPNSRAFTFYLITQILRFRSNSFVNKFLWMLMASLIEVLKIFFARHTNSIEVSLIFFVSILKLFDEKIEV